MALIDLIPERCSRVRTLVQNPSFEGQTLLLCVLDLLRTKRATLAQIGLTGDNPDRDQIKFVLKLKAISGLALVLNAAKQDYSLNRQLDDFMMFDDPAAIAAHNHASRFRHASLQVILWAIEEEQRLADEDEIPYAAWRMPIDILVAIGDEVSRWHEDLMQNLARNFGDEYNASATESYMRSILRQTFLETFWSLEDQVANCSMDYALDKIRSRFGLYSVSAVVS